MYFLNLSAEGEELSDFHIQAGIASCHTIAEEFEATDWSRILSYYDLLLWRDHSPVIALNRAIAVAMVRAFEAEHNDKIPKAIFKVATPKEIFLNLWTESRAQELKMGLAAAREERKRVYNKRTCTAC